MESQLFKRAHAENAVIATRMAVRAQGGRIKNWTGDSSTLIVMCADAHKTAKRLLKLEQHLKEIEAEQP